MDELKTVTCKICGIQKQSLAWHLKSHNLTKKEYTQQFNSPVSSKAFIESRKTGSYAIARNHELSKQKKEAYKQTCLQKYGVENVFQLSETKAKINSTNQKRYGVAWNTQTDNMKYKSIQTRLEKYGVKYYTTTEEFKGKRKKTSIQKYGTEYPQQSLEIKARMEAGFVKSLGVTNPMFSPQVIAKVKDTWNKYTPEQRQARIAKSFSTGHPSKVANQFIFALYNHGIDLYLEKDVRGFSADAYHLNSNTLIEFFGDIYHCNPCMFTNPDHYCPWISRTVKQQWDRDDLRINVFKQMGYKVLVIWENDWYSNPDDQIQKVIGSIT